MPVSKGQMHALTLEASYCVAVIKEASELLKTKEGVFLRCFFLGHCIWVFFLCFFCVFLNKAF